MNAGSSKLNIDIVRICLAGALGAVLVVLSIGGAASGGDSSTEGEKAVTLSEYDLLSRADTIEPRPYWVGPQPGTDRFELEIDTDESAFVRYAAGSGAPDDLLTVATYVIAEAQARLERAARAAGNDEDLSRGDGLTALADPSADSAYVVFDEVPEIQVEVYSPQAGFAAELVRSGAVTPLHWTPLG